MGVAALLSGFPPRKGERCLLVMGLEKGKKVDDGDKVGNGAN